MGAVPVPFLSPQATGARALASALERADALLTRLFLSGCESLGDVGVVSLAAALSNNTRLVELDLGQYMGGVGCGDVGATASGKPPSVLHTHPKNRRL